MHERCPICDLRLAGRPSCPNFWCGRDDRGFELVWAVAEHRGPVRRAVAGLKYRGEWWWAEPLGRMLAAFLLDQAPCFDDVDVILGVPGCAGRDHTRRILTVAGRALAGLWRIDAAGAILAKDAESRPLTGTPSAEARRLRAAVELRPSLTVRDAAAIRGRRILAVDDVFTDGSTLREVALALRAAGAVAVSGLVIARQPAWR